MSILSNVEIERALNDGELIIDPLPDGKPGDEASYDTCSVHLHLDNEVYEPKQVQVAFDLDQPGSIEETLKTYFERCPIRKGGYALVPGTYVCAMTREIVGFPTNDTCQLAGRIEGRSRFARVGLLVHFTAPTLHADWSGKICLELMNLGTQTILLRPRSAVCQLIVETVEGALRYGAAGDFDHQRLPTGGR